MTTKLSANINKIALLRNSRGSNYPNVVAFADAFLNHGADGITLHPRPDARHARYDDCYQLKALCDQHSKELNIEGYPSEKFLSMVCDVKPAQCTLVPDSPDQLTSDHGWRINEHAEMLADICYQLKRNDIRVSLFIDHDFKGFDLVKKLGADRVELYTEPYAKNFNQGADVTTFEAFKQCANDAQAQGIGVNAGHDLNQKNLTKFLSIPGILEVSIGHALIVECLEQGLASAMASYRKIIESSNLITS